MGRAGVTGDGPVAAGCALVALRDREGFDVLAVRKGREARLDEGVEDARGDDVS